MTTETTEGANARAAREQSEADRERVMRNLVVPVGRLQEQQCPTRPIIDERDLVRPPRDQQGGQTINFRCCSTDLRRVEVLKDGGEYPMFRTMSDVMRTALHLGLSALEGMRVEKGVFHIARWVNKLSAKEAEAHIIEGMLDKMQQIVTHNLQTDCVKAARAYVKEALKAVDSLERPIHQEHFRKLILGRFGYLIDSKRRDELDVVRKHAQESANPNEIVPPDGEPENVDMSLAEYDFD